VTGVCAMSISGFYIPPVLIYPRKGMKDSLSFGASVGDAFCCQEKGWMNTEVFCKCRCHFISVVKPTPDQTFLNRLVL